MAYKISSSTFSISSPVVIKNGTEGYGKILTTDASGLVVWKEPNSFFGSGRYIGELYGGGIVVDFWKEGDVENTLIMSLTHLSLDYVWSNVPTVSSSTFDLDYSTGAYSLYDGRYNSDLITRQQVFEQGFQIITLIASHTISAAKLCRDYKYGGYDDWYLPSYNEFNSIIKNKHIINRVLGDVNGIRSQNTGSGSALSGLYWTSTEYNERFSSVEEIFPGGPISFINSNTQYGIQYSTSESRFKAVDKTSNAMVRAVRREEKITGNGLVLSLDAGNKNSYDDSNRGNIWYDLVNKGITASAGYTFSVFPTSATGLTYSATSSGYFTFQNNSNSYINFKANLDNSTLVTVEMFARIRNGSGPMFGWTPGSYGVYLSSYGLGFWSGNADSYGLTLQRVSDYGLFDNWKHYVFVMNSDVSYTNNKIYINGDLITLSSANANIEQTKSFNNGSIRINNIPGITNAFGMDLAIFNVYKRELNQTEIINNFNEYKKRFEIKETFFKKDLILNLNSNSINSFNPSNLTTWYDERILSDISVNPPKNLIFASPANYTKSPGVYPGTYINFINNRASVATTITFNTSTTWEVWVKIDSITPSINNMIMGQTLPYFAVSASNLNKIVFSNSYTGISQIYHNSNSSVITGKWYHLAFTTKYDSVSNTTSSKIYINGDIDYEDTIFTTDPQITYNSDSIPGAQTNAYTSTRFAVGDGRDTNWQPFNGSISEVRIYNRTLNLSEIKNNYNSSKHLYDIDKNHYTHNFNTSPTFSIFQNLTLDFPNKKNNSILVSDDKGQVSLGTPSSIILDKPVKRSVGELYAGGIIVSVVDYKSSTNYLIASLEDLPSVYYWSTLAGSLPEFSTGTIEFNGAYNTSQIKTSLGAGSYAAMTASVYNYGGYTDWYLPSSNELREAYNNISILNLVLGKNSLIDTYWSSSESTYSSEVYPDAFAFNFGSVLSDIPGDLTGLGALGATSSGLEFRVGKYNLLKVRPFRKEINNNYIALIMVIKTNNPGSSAANAINIPTNPALSTSLYKYDVDWGDGTKSTGLVSSTNKTYATAGTYTIKISGRFPSIFYANAGDRLKILEIKSWGNIKWSTMEGAFYGCSNLIISALDAPDLSGVTNMDSMFRGCASLNQSINHWNVSNVINMTSLFNGCTIFNKPLNNWDVSKVQNMSYMFSDASAFNQSLNSWNTALVQNMSFMFYNATVFNQPLTRSGNSWNLQSVTDMGGMFYLATSFNQSLNSWNTLNVIQMNSMFFQANAFNNGSAPGVSGTMTLDTRSVKYMNSMFYGAGVFNQSIATSGNSWNVSLVIDMTYMFRDALSFNQNIGNWTISNVLYFLDFMAGKTNLNFSTTNLDAIYIGWASRPVKNNISINFGTAKRTSASTAARLVLTSSPRNWIITDGGI